MAASSFGVRILEVYQDAIDDPLVGSWALDVSLSRER